ncbi:tRNA threonylcarbamoyl adenosine modification protein (Sua5/YciO/YrdC/YwlC family) [Jatrophihabitans sp. GAS493]|uniref:L-threonylcarbamoyladenylate synthase n=1 Tax=Jatrophihabitans sp. GAS493 TaxID=1907575 RepID=UPI000BB7C5C4|nr:L-threonylcarbamoyladenylate synthase [Jatrophihabitans sp. GAS493]SOD73305.1 tRNA threonylcarbamoyl adenosine modification protein (Sua5/YciO/YrdC/YwlC family) [Jatrophihabitans sp. GAS493]
MSTVVDCADPQAREDGLVSATRAVQSGQLVVLPTDTVYGIGADAFDSVAVTSLLAAKGRGRDMPVPVLVGSWNTIDGLVSSVNAATRSLIEAFWPGGLTLVVEHAPSLSWDLGDSRGTVALRMPLHPVALELLALTGPMAVSSANRSGHPAALTAEEALEQLGGSVSVYLDGGPATTGIASTIVDVTGDIPRVLRTGAVSLERLRDVLGELVGDDTGAVTG